MYIVVKIFAVVLYLFFVGCSDSSQNKKEKPNEAQESLKIEVVANENPNEIKIKEKEKTKLELKDGTISKANMTKMHNQQTKMPV